MAKKIYGPNEAVKPDPASCDPGDIFHPLDTDVEYVNNGVSWDLIPVGPVAKDSEFDALAARVTALETKVTALETSVADHEARIAALEGGE